jgi:hypothetical protein
LRSRHAMIWLILILSVSMIIASEITSARAQETITVNSASSNVTLNVHIEFQENITDLSNANFSLDSSNSSQALVVNSFQSAVKRIVPAATVDPTSFKLAGNVRQQKINSTTWIISENLTLTVAGVASNKPGTSSYNLGFVAMNMSDSLKYAGFEFNNIGPAYLLGAINSQGGSTTFFLDRALIRGGPYLNPVIPGLATQTFSLLDFSWIPKVSNWINTYKPLDTSSMWTLNPGQDRPGLPYNLTVGVKSPEGTILFVRVAYYNLDLELTAPARAVASGSTITFNVPTSTDFVMPTIVGATIVVAAASFVAEKRLVKPTGQFRKKRKG